MEQESRLQQETERQFQEEQQRQHPVTGIKEDVFGRPKRGNKPILRLEDDPRYLQGGSRKQVIPVEIPPNEAHLSIADCTYWTSICYLASC